MGQMRLFEKAEPARQADNKEGEVVSYDRLRISSATPVHCGEEAKYLLDENQSGVSSQFGTSKWNA